MRTKTFYVRVNVLKRIDIFRYMTVGDFIYHVILTLYNTCIGRSCLLLFGGRHI